MFVDRDQFKLHLSCNPDFSLSRGSIITYANNVEKFFRLYEDLNQETIDDYYLNLREKNKPSYVNLILNAIKQYAKFKELDIRIPKELKNIKNDTREIITYDYLMHDIFESVDTGDFQDPLQTKAILVFMFYTGLRLQDYLGLQRSDFVFKANYGYVTCYVKKNKFIKKVFFPKNTFKHVISYFDTTAEIDNAFNLKPTTIRYIVDKLDKMVSDIHIHPHIFRASAINYLYKDCGWTVEKIAKIIGISSQTILNNYLIVSMSDIEEEYNERMKNK